MKVGIVSLGCAKNLVDSEMVLSLFSNSGFDITPSPEEADVIVINTCGFINDAKKESIDNIFDILKYHKKVVVIGCLVERYKEELQKEIPEVDLWISIKEYPHMKEAINSLFTKEEVKVELNPFSRILSTPFYQAYLR